MMDVRSSLPTPNASPCGPSMEEALSLYVDGELPSATQPALFTHLASCEACRQTLTATLEFRRFSRQETITVPPAVDEAIMKRLAQRKATHDRTDRAAQRRPLWQARIPVSLRAAAALGLVAFFTGLLVPNRVAQAPEVVVEATSTVQGEEERVRFYDPVRVAEAVYVIYPGLTVEAFKAVHEESPSPESL
ncbi:MAG: anti-sigma factor family protein [Rhodothermales bacterium]